MSERMARDFPATPALARPEFVPTKSQVNAAGARLASARLGQRELSSEEMLDAIRVVDAWRQLHAEPLAWVTEKLMGRVSPIAVHAVVAQRLKRMPQIIKKLARYENMNLARMQDLGGCRVVLDQPEEVEEAARAIRSYGSNRWVVRHEADYRDDGRADTAYRALHMIVLRDDRLIEIQLRTLRQHAWAEAVERVTALSDHDVKEGRAPDEFLEYFKLASDGLYRMDCGETLNQQHRRRFRDLHRLLGRYVLGES
jgi:putative GTP pyrophosphokinase